MTFHLCFMILVFFMVFVSAQHGSSTVIVEQGELEGKLYTSRNGAEYFGYLSIPFAKPPVGELRFEPPQPPDPWKGVRVATEKPPQCIQLSVFTSNPENLKPIGQEDCLYLNVFTPKQKTDLVPVMVFIHGGAFVEGSSAMYDTSYFMDHKIVTVTIQYRLSVFGFLSTRDNIISGNNGMKDQVLALKWVQKNIAAFGGDPKRVTIFGESAGSGSVHYHLYSPLSKGLFHQAICQSGTSLDPWARIPRNLAYQQADALGVLTDCNTRDAKTFVKCLKKLPANELMMAHYKFYIWDLEPVIPFSVVLEEDVAGAFITRNPEFEKPVNDVPLIIGINQAEGGIKSARYLDGDGAKATYLNEHYERLFPIIFYYRSWIKDERRISEITQRLKKFYFGDKNIGTGTTHELTTLFTDGYFSYGSIEATHRYRKYNKVYFYYYDHRNKDTFCGILGKTSEDLGVCHGDDLFSLFYLDGFFPKITEGDDFQVSTRLVNYWVNFAYHGTPNDLWKPVESDNFEYLHITTKEDKMETHLIDERYQFWKSLKIDRNIDDVPAEKDETAEESTTSTLLIVVLIIAGIGIVTAVGVGLWFLCKRRNEIVHE